MPRSKSTRRGHRVTRRTALKALGLSALAAPFYQMFLSDPRRASANVGSAQRLIVFYFPDGVPGTSDNGELSKWHATGSETQFTLPEVLSPLEPFRDQCVFFNGLSMGGTDSGSHPGGAKKLLTGVDGGFGQSIDQYLANTVGAASPHRMLYLGSMANVSNASGDKHISYPNAGQSTAPEDHPIFAFDRVFGGSYNGGDGGGGVTPGANLDVSVIDGSLAELQALRGRLGTTEQAKLNLHLESLREVERRIRAQAQDTPPPSTCQDPYLDASSFQASRIHESDHFPTVLELQIDLMVQAMACNQTRVGVIQCSHHTSELIMSRFVDTEMHDAGFDMRSHQASHYGPAHDFGRREFSDFVKQRRWFVSQFANLLGRLRSIPEGDGNMLDNSLVLMCTEVSDGNTHLHDNMPFVLAGGGNGAIRTGRLLQFDYLRHSHLLVSLARAMGQDIWQFGQESNGPVPGLLTF